MQKEIHHKITEREAAFIAYRLLGVSFELRQRIKYWEDTGGLKTEWGLREEEEIMRKWTIIFAEISRTLCEDNPNG